MATFAALLADKIIINSIDDQAPANFYLTNEHWHISKQKKLLQEAIMALKHANKRIYGDE